MKWLFFLLLISWNISQASLLIQGNDSDDGGLMVICDPSLLETGSDVSLEASGETSLNQLEGRYFYDYLMSFDLLPELQYREVESVEEVFDITARVLWKYAPILWHSFEEYRRNYLQRKTLDASQKQREQGSRRAVRSWSPLNGEILPVTYDNIKQRIPHCEEAETIVRRDVKELTQHTWARESITYYYHQEAFDEGSGYYSDRPVLQISMAAHHEWLWDFFGDINSVIEVNKLIHSTYWQSLLEDGAESLGDFNDRLTEWGLPGHYRSDNPEEFYRYLANLSRIEGVISDYLELQFSGSQAEIYRGFARAHRACWDNQALIRQLNTSAADEMIVPRLREILSYRENHSYGDDRCEDILEGRGDYVEFFGLAEDVRNSRVRTPPATSWPEYPEGGFLQFID